MGVRRTQDGFTEYYDNRLDKNRLWDKYLDVIDKTNEDLSGWLDDYVLGLESIERCRNIEQTKRELQRIIKKNRG